MCVAQAMTEEEVENVGTNRVDWWLCVLQVWLCVYDAVTESDDNKKKEAEKQAAAEKEAAEQELQTYLNQCEREYSRMESNHRFFVYFRVQLKLLCLVR